MTKHKIVLVSFPFDDSSQSKVRPVVCLTNAIGAHKHIVVAFITSQIPTEKLNSDLLVKLQDNNFKLTGLTVDSVILLHKLVTIPQTIIKRELGYANAKLAKEIHAKLMELFEK